MTKIRNQATQRKVYIWNIAGSLANAIFSVLVLMIVTRSVNENQADIFSLAWSIGQLMLIIATFQIRTYQATDIAGKYTFNQYLHFRIVTILIMIVSSLVYVFIKEYSIYKSAIILVMCMVRAIEALSDVYEGWFQQKERLDLAGKVIAYRVFVSLLVFAATLSISKNLLLACLALLLCFIVSFVLYNLRYSKEVAGMHNAVLSCRQLGWVLTLFKEGLPIFLNAFLMMSIMNAPKMSIDTAIAAGVVNEGGQAIFNILFMPASFINLAYIVFRPMITSMAIAWNAGKKGELIKILLKIEISLLGISLLLLAGTRLCGIPLLSWFYGIDLTMYEDQLLTVVAGGCFYTFASVFDNALIAMRKHHILVVAYVVAWVYVQIIVDKMVFSNELAGAAMAYTSTMFIFLMTTMILFLLFILKIRKRNGE